MADRDAIVRVALDYFEGWFDGDAAHGADAPSRSAKRSPDAPAPGNWAFYGAGDDRGHGEGGRKTRDVPDRGIEVEVEHVHREIANVTVRSAVYVEYLHLVRTGEGWKIINPSGSTLEPRDGHAISVRCAQAQAAARARVILASTRSPWQRASAATSNVCRLFTVEGVVAGWMVAGASVPG